MYIALLRDAAPVCVPLCDPYTVRSLTYAPLFSSVNRWAGLIVFGDLRFQATAAVTSTGKSTECPLFM